MGRLFQCPRCGKRNKIGQRYCSTCGQAFYYTCMSCNTFVDSSFKYCPNCSTLLNWTVKPRVNLLPGQTPAHVSTLGRGYKVLLPLVVAVFILALALSSYLLYYFSLGGPLLPEGYESYQVPEAASESYVMSQTGAQYSGNPPYLREKGERIYLVNNPTAVNVNFEELKAFIVEDQTDKELYVPGLRMCGYFAETLHNNAEQDGKRAALAIVEFADGLVPHALNVFETTDMGLIYIDCTGAQRSPSDFQEWIYKLFYPMGQDRMAYVVKGKEYGTILLKDAESTHYDYYIGYTKSWVRDEHIFFSRPGIVKSVAIYW